MNVGGAYRHIPGGAEAAELRHKEELEEIKERQRIWGPPTVSPRGLNPGKVQAGNEVGPSDVRAPLCHIALHHGRTPPSLTHNRAARLVRVGGWVTLPGAMLVMNTYTEQQTSSQLSYSTLAVGCTNPGKYASPLPHTKHPLTARSMLALRASVWWGRKCRRWEAGLRKRSMLRGGRTCAVSAPGLPSWSKSPGCTGLWRWCSRSTTSAAGWGPSKGRKMPSVWRSAACVRAADDSRAAAESVGEGMGRLSGISAAPARAHVCACACVCLCLCVWTMQCHQKGTPDLWWLWLPSRWVLEVLTSQMASSP
jgi:hypothetical protein